MIEIKETCTKGTTIRLGNEKRILLNKMIEILYQEGFEEISLPIIQEQSIFNGKVGEENHHMMYNFQDRGSRNLCLAPEYTAIVQILSQGFFKQQKDVKLFYIQECFRGEKPQAGRYRQFTQLGVEILNPTKEYISFYLSGLAQGVIECSSLSEVSLDFDVKRGLDYYKEGKGFEMRSKEGLQLLGGGEYEGGVGFAIGIDRLILLNN